MTIAVNPVKSSRTDRIEVRRLGGFIGAEILDVDLRRPLSDDEIEQIHVALDEHHVIFFRDQHLSGDEQQAFAARFGTLETSTPVRGAEAVTFIEDTVDNPPHTDQWHTDHSCMAAPPAIAFLFSLDIPPYGGDTIWVSLSAIYDNLSPTMRLTVRGLRQRHGVVGEYRASIENYLRRDGLPADEIRLKIEAAERTQTNVHPLVRTHPRTGHPSVYLSPRFSAGLVDVPDDESNALLTFLHSHLDDPNLQIRWRWRPNDLAIWDEVATAHRALSDHFASEPQYRRMRRCTVAGTTPFFDPVKSGRFG